ncbi:MAG: DUF1573 domain-containing protein, partial [Phycisphaerae bacterium]|nr:DUF1573 domain-containing protein [Phycisphaerae bacterium]
MLPFARAPRPRTAAADLVRRQARHSQRPGFRGARSRWLSCSRSYSAAMLSLQRVDGTLRHGLARAFALAVVVGLWFSQPVLAQGANAAVLVDPPFISLGLMQPRDTVTRSFRLSNITDKPITIASVVPTCTCTTVDATGKVIPPKGSIDIPLTMKVAASTGVKTAAVTLTFSDRSAPITLQMQGEIAYAVRSTCIDVIENKRVPYINVFADPQRSPSVAPPP